MPAKPVQKEQVQKEPASPKPTARSINPRLIKRGDLIKTETGLVEVVRNVSIILHLANGADFVYRDENPVEVLDNPAPVTETELASLQDNS